MNTRVTSFSNFHIAAACCQWIGGRDQQEDACCLQPAEDSNQAESFMAVLADGMGGVADGEKASRHLVDSFMCAYAGKCGGSIPTADTMALCLSYANQSLGDLKSEGRIDKDAGATFIALSISNDTMTWLNVGDSLLYRQQGNNITKINTAHTWQWELDRRVNSGEMTPEEAEAAPGPRHALYSAVCGEEYVEAELINDRPCRVGDRYIIASDGLQPLIDTGWEPLLNSPEVRSAPPVEVCNLLMNKLKLLRASNQDNTSIIIIDILPVENYTADYATVSLIGDRNSQQDNEACWKSDKAMLAVVADGAGGHSGGELASRAAVDSLQNTWHQYLAAGVPPARAEEILGEALLTAHQEVIARSGGNAKFCGKCAVVVVYLCNGSYTVANVGDCRAYQARKDKWKQLTIDDSLLRILLERGEVSPEEARNHPDQSCLTQALGTTGKVKPHISSGEYTATDRFLLCCDGLWNQLPDELWGMNNWQANSPKEHNELINRMGMQAVQAADGKSDNVSAIWLHTLPAPPFFRIRKYHYILGAAALLVGLAGSSVMYYVHQKNEKARIAAEKAEEHRKAAEEAARKAALELARNTEQLTANLKELHAGALSAQPLIVQAAAQEVNGQPAIDKSALKLILQIAIDIKELADVLPIENINIACDSIPAEPASLKLRICDFCRDSDTKADMLTEEHILNLLGWQEALSAARKAKEDSELAAKEKSEKLQHIHRLLGELLFIISESAADVQKAAAEVAANNELSGQTILQGILYLMRENCNEVKECAESLPAEAVNAVYEEYPAELQAAITAAPLTDEHLLALLGWDAALKAAQQQSSTPAQGMEGDNKEQPDQKDKQNDEKEKARRILEDEFHIEKKDYAHYVLLNYNQPAMLRWLITAGADVNAADQHGCTALHWAVGENQIECVKLLLSAPGIDINKVDQANNTALGIAEKSGNKECARLIQEAVGQK